MFAEGVKYIGQDSITGDHHYRLPLPRDANLETKILINDGRGFRIDDYKGNKHNPLAMPGLRDLVRQNNISVKEHVAGEYIRIANIWVSALIAER